MWSSPQLAPSCENYVTLSCDFGEVTVQSHNSLGKCIPVPHRSYSVLAVADLKNFGGGEHLLAACGHWLLSYRR